VPAVPPTQFRLGSPSSSAAGLLYSYFSLNAYVFITRTNATPYAFRSTFPRWRNRCRRCTDLIRNRHSVNGDRRTEPFKPKPIIRNIQRFYDPLSFNPVFRNSLYEIFLNTPTSTQLSRPVCMFRTIQQHYLLWREIAIQIFIYFHNANFTYVYQ